MEAATAYVSHASHPHFRSLLGCFRRRSRSNGRDVRFLVTSPTKTVMPHDEQQQEVEYLMKTNGTLAKKKADNAPKDVNTSRL